MSRYVSYSERMQVSVPVGEVDGLRVQKFEVKHPDDWLESDEKRTDVCRPMEYYRMMLDNREPGVGWYTRLVDYKNLDEDDWPVTWMSDTTAERLDHLEPVQRIHLSKARRVLVNGLGLGMVLQAALSYDRVEHVDVVEADERVIELVGPHYLKDPRVSIVHADAYEQAKAWPRGTRWDVGWSDIWPELSADNLDGMDRLHEVYRRRCVWHGMWGRKICLGLRRELRSFGLL